MNFALVCRTTLMEKDSQELESLSKSNLRVMIAEGTKILLLSLNLILAYLCPTLEIPLSPYPEACYCTFAPKVFFMIACIFPF